MTLWELQACIAGHNRAQGVEDAPDPPSSADLASLIERHAPIISRAKH